MMRRAMGYFTTLTLVLALLAGGLWVASYRTTLRWSFTGSSTQRSVGSSRGLIGMATDYWAGKPKSLGHAGGRAELKSWSEFDNRWRSLLKSGTSSASASHGFVSQTGFDSQGQVVWRLLAAPFWALVVALLIPSLIRLCLPRRKDRTQPIAPPAA